MTALTYMIDRFWFHVARHPADDVDLIIDRTRADCLYVGIDWDKIGAACFGGSKNFLA